MDIKLIHNEQLKITLLKTDMEELDVDYKNLDYKNPRVRSVLLTLFSGAVRQTGFKISGGKLLIEAFPAKEGGCVLYFTRLQNEKKKYRKTSIKKPLCIYKFNNSSDMQDALERISIYNTPLLEMYYKDGCFYLTADNPAPFLKSLLREFSDSEDEVKSNLFLEEYAKYIQSV